VINLGNYNQNDIAPKPIFDELRKNSNSMFTFTRYHWRRSGNFLLQVHSTTPSRVVEAAISCAINQVLGDDSNLWFDSIIRTFKTLQALMDYARDETALEGGKSNCLKNGVPVKVTAVFTEAARCLQETWPRTLSKRVEVLGNIQQDAGTLLALYSRPEVGDDIGEAAIAVKKFYKRQGIVVHSTARAISVIHDIVTGRLRS
jgi:hypothetical protein